MATIASRDHQAVIAVAALSLLVSAPYAVLGPNLLLDDWFTLWFRMRDGLLWTGGHDQLAARPGAFVLFGIQFGLIGAHPLALYALQVAVNTVSATLLVVAARPFVGRTRALAVAAVWVLLANHSTTDRWFATLPAAVSLMLLLVGITLLERAVTADRSPAPAVAAMVASALCYEVSLAPAAVALLAVPWLLGRRPDLWWLARWEAPLVLTGVWMLANSQHTSKQFSGWFDFGAMVDAHLGSALVRPRVVAGTLALAGAIGLVLTLGRAGFGLLRWVPRDASLLVAAAMAVIAVGTLAFVRYPIAPLALGDRANAVAAVGTALLWVGIGVLVWRAPRPVAAGITGLFLVTLLVGRVQRDVDYARAGDDSVRILAALRATAPDRPPGRVVVGPGPVYHHGITGLIGPLDQAVRADSGDPTRMARMAEDEADFLATPPALRLDVRQVLNRR